MEFLFLTSFCLFNVLFCSTSYCLPIESVEGYDIDWKYGFRTGGSDAPVFRGPRPTFSNIAAFCNVINPDGNQKLFCFLCKGWDITCLLTTTASATTSTIPAITTPAITTIPIITNIPPITITPTTAPTTVPTDSEAP